MLRAASLAILALACMGCATPGKADLSDYLARSRAMRGQDVRWEVAETLDFAVYEPLRKRGLLVAMLASNAVGLLADSLLFLKLAFGSLEYLPGQMLGKAWMTLAAVAVIAVIQRRRVRVVAA